MALEGRYSQNFYIIIGDELPASLPAYRAQAWEGAHPDAYGVLFRNVRRSGAPFTRWTQLGQEKVLDTPNFQAGVLAFRNDDSM